MIGQTAIKNNKKQKYGGGLTALYARLSKDDELIGDSNSIVHQKEMLAKYAKEHGFTNTEFYVDDGYSGTNFNHPDFQRMMADVEEGKINRKAKNFGKTGDKKCVKGCCLSNCERIILCGRRCGNGQT